MTEANSLASPQPEVAENQDDRPSTSTGRASSLLHSLLGQTFSDAAVTPLHHQSARVIADEEMTRYRSTPPLSLSEDPLNRWACKQSVLSFALQNGKEVFMRTCNQCLCRESVYHCRIYCYSPAKNTYS